MQTLKNFLFRKRHWEVVSLDDNLKYVTSIPVGKVQITLGLSIHDTCIFDNPQEPNKVAKLLNAQENTNTYAYREVSESVFSTHTR